VQKQAPTVGRLLTMVVFALSCFGLLLFLWLSFGGPTPLRPKGYQVQVAFDEATQLGLEADVRVAGVSVGKVRKKELAPEGNLTLATLELDSRFAPLKSDARATLRQKTLLGETFVELTPGSKTAPPIPEGGRLRQGQVRASVELDEVIRAFDPTTRKAFRGWQQELAKVIDGRGQDLNAAFGSLPRLADSGERLLATLDRQEEEVRQLVRGTGQTFDALSADTGALQRLITGTDGVFRQTQAQQERLAETIRIFPTFLDESRATFARLERFAGDTRPLVRELRAPVRDLGPTLRDVRGLAPDLERTFRRLDPLISASQTGLPALRDVLGDARPALGALQPFLEELNPILRWLEIYQSFTSDFISNGAAALADTTATRTADERGHYLRQFSPNGPEAAGIFPNRTTNNRGNTYLPPDGMTGPDHAKYMVPPSWDCNNASKPAPFVTELGSRSEPSCWVSKLPGTSGPGQFPKILRDNYSEPAR
jgi:phospholipid/cholesterol/gamma-HCH transport system substrate-binding protein